MREKGKAVMKLPPAFLLLTLPLLSGHCRAAAEASGLPDPVAGLGQMLFGLALVFGILAACVWLLKRFSSPVRANGLLRVIGVTAVGPREKVVLIEAGEKILMLGVTPTNVRTLHIFGRDELPLAATPVPPPACPGAALAASFANRLTQALKGRRDEG